MLAPRRLVAFGAACLAAFGLLAVALPEVRADWERSVSQTVSGFPSGLFEVSVVGLMQAGSRLAIVAVAIILLVLGRRRDAVVSLAAGWFAWVTATLMKDLVERPRPTEASLTGTAREHAAGFGFPSSHSAVAMALAVAVATMPATPRWVRVAAVAVAVVTAFGRVYVGAHFTLDVVGGALLGAGIAFLVRAAEAGAREPDSTS